jgi:hypothetical protein
MLDAVVMAILFAAFGVRQATGALLAGTVLALPIRLAVRLRKLEAALWSCAGYPVVCVLSLYATWLAGWLALGHPPRKCPEDMSPGTILVQVLLMNTLVLLLGMPVVFLAHSAIFCFQCVRALRRRESKSFMALMQLGLSFAPWLCLVAFTYRCVSHFHAITSWLLD